MLSKDYLIGYLNAMLDNNIGSTFREVVESLIGIITVNRDNDEKELQQYLSKDWVSADIRPYELIVVHALITKADDSFLNKDGTYKYIEAEAIWEPREKAGFRIVTPYQIPKEEAENWKVMWWHYKTERPTYLKPLKQEHRV